MAPQARVAGAKDRPPGPRPLGRFSPASKGPRPFSSRAAEQKSTSTPDSLARGGSPRASLASRDGGPGGPAKPTPNKARPLQVRPAGQEKPPEGCRPLPEAEGLPARKRKGDVREDTKPAARSPPGGSRQLGGGGRATKPPPGRSRRRPEGRGAQQRPPAPPSPVPRLAGQRRSPSQKLPGCSLGRGSPLRTGTPPATFRQAGSRSSGGRIRPALPRARLTGAPGRRESALLRPGPKRAVQQEGGNEAAAAATGAAPGRESIAASAGSSAARCRGRETSSAPRPGQHGWAAVTRWPSPPPRSEASPARSASGAGGKRCPDPHAARSLARARPVADGGWPACLPVPPVEKGGAPNKGPLSPTAKSAGPGPGRPPQATDGGARHGRRAGGRLRKSRSAPSVGPLPPIVPGPDTSPLRPPAFPSAQRRCGWAPRVKAPGSWELWGGPDQAQLLSPPPRPLPSKPHSVRGGGEAALSVGPWKQGLDRTKD